jgi:hypothetical protein
MLLVLVFIALVLSFFSVSQRYIASALRTDTAQLLRRERDEGTLRALGRGLALLETGFPTENPYSCGTTIVTSAGPRTYTVTFSQEGADPEGRPRWSVRAAPTGPYDSPPPMPQRFTGTSPP